MNSALTCPLFILTSSQEGLPDHIKLGRQQLRLINSCRRNNFRSGAINEESSQEDFLSLADTIPGLLFCLNDRFGIWNVIG
jgi:hypothetical protein